MKTIFFVCSLLVLSVLEVNSDGFGYAVADQKRWRRRHASCGGRHQSPISINTRKTIPLRIPALEMVGYHNLLSTPIKLHNNGHSVSLSLPHINEFEKIPYIFGAKLDSEYELEGLHFHWGDRNNRGSEHVLNDIRYPMEMHIIHRNKKYKSMSEAILYHDGLTVLGFFYQVRDEEAKELNPLVRNLSLIEDYDTSMLLNTSFTLASLLPKNLDRFYTYKGSLTTPPCSEAVTWILFPEILPISVYQMEKFRELSSGHDSILADNFRYLQPLHNRRVFVRTIKGNSPKYIKYNNIHYTKWDWLGTDSLEQENEVIVD